MMYHGQKVSSLKLCLKHIVPFFTGILRKSRIFLGDQRGVSAVEFALLLPVMVLIYAGVVDVSRGVEADKKVNRVASVVGDLVSRQIKVEAIQLDDIFEIGAATMAPAGGKPEIKITFLNIEDKKVGGQLPARVLWSHSTRGMVTDKPGQRIDIPDNLRIEKLSYIRVEVQYKYQPLMSFAIPALNLSEVYYLSPRYTNEIPCNGC